MNICHNCGASIRAGGRPPKSGHYYCGNAACQHMKSEEEQVRSQVLRGKLPISALEAFRWAR